MSRVKCSVCERQYDVTPSGPWRCDCGGPFDVSTRPVPAGSAPPFDRFDSREGIWAFSDFLPIPKRITLGEGFTPVLFLDDWEAWMKLEYVSPTGSFKDRGGATVVSQAVDLGVSRVVEDSSGNAGIAIAQYAACAGLAATVFVPSAVSSVKRRVIKEAGAEVKVVEGGRDDVADECMEYVDSDEGWYASHVWNPAFLMGIMTFSLELCAQRDWVAPDAVVCPVGNGTLLLGAYYGFDSLVTAGWIEQMPRLLGVQAAGFDPITELFDGPIGGQNGIATGIQVRNPARISQIETAITATNGYVISVSESDVTKALDRLHRSGLLVEPTSAVAPAGLEVYRDRGLLSDDADVVIPLTGTGLKSA